MGTDYINLNFSGIDDLKTLDSRVNELESLKSTIKSISHAKANDSEFTSVPLPNDDTDNELLEQGLKSVNNAISDCLSQNSVRESIDIIDKQIQLYGEAEVFVKLKSQLTTKLHTTKYIEIIQTAKAIQSSLKADLTVEELQKVASQISDLKQETTNPGLIEQITHVLNQNLQDNIDQRRSVLESDLSKILAENKWFTKKGIDFSGSNTTQLEATLQDLVRLQAIINTPSYPETWWALDILLGSVITRFNFHFNTPNKETNKLSKPEWALQFMETFLSENLPQLTLIVGNIYEPLNKFSEYEIITTILKPLRLKTLSMIKILNKNVQKYQSSGPQEPEEVANYERSGRLLTHLIFELSSFDQRIRSNYQYNPYIEDLNQTPSKKWTGLTGDVFVRGGDEHSAVNNWLIFEKELANKRFNSEILSGKDSFEIDYDYGTANDQESTGTSVLKPTYSAYSLVKLFDNLTSHFQTLSIVKYQLKYVSTIQLALIDEYCEHLSRKFRKFSETYGQGKLSGLIPGGLSSTHIEPVSAETSAVAGLKTLESLTQIYCSAKYVENSLEQRSMELIFIQLWDTFKKFSAKEHSEDSTILNSSLVQYEELLSKVVSKYEEFFKREIRALLKNYVNSSTWDLQEASDVEASPNLASLVSTIPRYLELLARCMSPLDYYLITNKIVTLVSSILYEYIITNHQFTKPGIWQLSEDVKFLWLTLAKPLYLESERNEFSNKNNPSYVKLNQSVEFLGAVDYNMAMTYRKRSEYSELRSNLSTDISALSDSDLNDLLLRII